MGKRSGDCVISYFNNYYKDKTVLVTGHTGFKGSWLSIWLNELGANVVGYSLDPYTERDNFVLSHLENKLVDIRGDIRDIDKLKEVFQNYEPNIVFHLAAQPLVRLSYDKTRETFEQNIMGTINVLECVRDTHSVESCINITSDKCYDNKEWIWGYRENDPMGGYDPYSASKGCCELVINSYINSFFNPEHYETHNKVVASVRAGNVIGGGDWSNDRIIPDCINSIENNEKIGLRNPDAIRPWQHVLEPLSGYLWLGTLITSDSKKYSGAWNFGPTSESIISVKEVVERLILDFPGSPDASWIDNSSINQPHEAQLLNLDCSKASHILRWEPTLSTNQCIELTREWYTKYSHEDVYQLCVNQIEYYCKLASLQRNQWAKSQG